MALFLDTFVNKLDRKGRVSVPASYRQALAGQSYQGIVALPSFKHHSIHCGDLAWLADVSKDLDAVELFSETHDDLTTALFADTRQLPFDSEGRIILPPALIDHAAIKDLAAFVGFGSHFEIWEPAALDAFKSEARRRALEKGRTLTRRHDGNNGGNGGGK